MQSKKLRIYTDHGKTYTFNRYRFIDLLSARTTDVDGITKSVSQTRSLTEIADKLDITPDAIKAWKSGKTNPKCLNYVKTCADVLGVNYLELLTPCKKEEMNKLNDNEVALLKNVFAGCIDCYYEYTKLRSELKTGNKKHYEIESLSSEKLSEMIDRLHSIADQNSLFVSEDIRYRVHSFLIKFEQGFGLYDTPYEWNDVKAPADSPNTVESIVGINVAHALPYSQNREDAIHVLGLFYLGEEQDLALKLSLEYKEIPEHYYDDYDLDGVPFDEDGNPKDLTQFFCPDYEFKPIFLCRDYFTRIMKNAFRVEFPELETT